MSAPATTDALEPLLGVVAEIADERRKQIGLGYDASHDDQHIGRQILWAHGWGVSTRISMVSACTHPNPRHALIEAAAMLVAEIERMDREAALIATETRNGC